MSGLPQGYELREGADAEAAYQFLTTSYWAKGCSLETVESSLAHSLSISIWFNDEQIAMARVVTDNTTFAYLNDVYVLTAHRGLGLSKCLLSHLISDPRLKSVGRWALFTQDAQSLYAQFGFREYPWPERMMIIDPKVFPA